MAIDVIVQQIGRGWFKTTDEADIEKCGIYHHNQPLQAHIKGMQKERSYLELSCYKGSCKYIANMNFNKNMDTPSKVDFLTKIRCGFVESMIVDTRMGQTHYIPKSLSYSNCEQPESHKYIADALEKHALLVGIEDVNIYVQLLRDQK